MPLTAAQNVGEPPGPFDPISDPIEWSGNPLATGGTKCTFGSVEAELMHIDPAIFGFFRGSTDLKRTWWLYVFDADDMRIEKTPTASVMLFNLMPEPAKREAETIIRWAATTQTVIEASQE